MVGDRLISDFIRRLERFSSNKPKENQPTGYEPLAQAAKKISQIITNAEEKTVRALAATNPNDELGRVLAQIAMLIRGENEEVPGITKPEAKIAQAVYGARNLISQAEGTALEAAQNLSGTESTIQEIAAGRLQAISLQENLSPSLKSKDTLTPEGVVQIGKESLAKAGREIQGALASLQATAEPGTIPPILAALIKLSGTGEIPPISLENNPDQIEVSKPDSGTAVAKSVSLIGEVEKQTRLRIGEVIERENGDRFKDEILENGRLTDTDPLITAINFINSDSSSLWSLAESDETIRDLDRYKELGDNNANRGRRFALVARALNKYLDFKESNYKGRLTGEEQKINLATKLISHTGSDPINSLTQSEREGLANSGGLARGGFINWVLRVTLDAVNGDKSKATRIGLSSYDDLLRLFNNIQSLTV